MINPKGGLRNFLLSGRRMKDKMLPAAAGLLPGMEIRYVTGLYLQRVCVLALVTLTIVVALDISLNFQSVMSLTSQEVGVDGFQRLVYYAFLRVGFVTPSILLFAGVWGIVWSEYSLSISRERMMFFGCGHSYLYCLIPALLTGVVVGVLHFSIVTFIKPKTVELEATTTHRQYGPKFERPTLTERTWISGSGYILNARIEFAETVSLKNAEIFRFDDHGSVQKIITAARVRPVDNSAEWQLHRVAVSEFQSGTTGANSGRLVVSDEKHEVLNIDLALNPVWLENFRIIPSLLPHKVLTTLVNNGEGIPDLYKYQMAIYERYASILYCISTILLSAYLALSTFPPNMMPLRALGVAFVGYGAYFLFSLALMLGQFGYIPVFIAAWGIPGLVSLSFLGLLARHIRGMRTIMAGRSA